MATNVDMGGDTLYVSDIVYGDNTPAKLSGTSLNTQINSLDQPGNIAFKRYTFTGINMNVATTDHTLAFTLPTGTTTYEVSECIIWGASHTLTTATAGLFTAASGGGYGSGICADQAITITSGTANTDLNAQSLTQATDPAAKLTCFTANPLYFRVGTAEGATATANVTLILRVLG